MPDRLNPNRCTPCLQSHHDRCTGGMCGCIHTAAQIAKARRDGLRLRDGDQPLPLGNGRPGAHDQLIAALVARRELGLRRYGQLLQPHNGRDTARDLLEELLDAAVYAQTLETELADLRALERAARLTLAHLPEGGLLRLPLLEAALDVLDDHVTGDTPTR